MVISLLVSYALLFGGIAAPLFERLIIPALLAFLLNFVREIIKDIQDEPGDRAAGIRTTAALPLPVIRTIVYCVTAFYCGLLFLPVLLHQFGRVYALVCAVAVLPVCVAWTVLFAGKNWRMRLPLLSTLLKIEMAAGLAALAADHLLG
jgi:4-hydroxybenzoate polyprenyltransferase